MRSKKIFVNGRYVKVFEIGEDGACIEVDNPKRRYVRDENRHWVLEETLKSANLVIVPMKIFMSKPKPKGDRGFSVDYGANKNDPLIDQVHELVFDRNSGKAYQNRVMPDGSIARLLVALPKKPDVLSPTEFARNATTFVRRGRHFRAS